MYMYFPVWLLLGDTTSGVTLIYIFISELYVGNAITQRKYIICPFQTFILFSFNLVVYLTENLQNTFWVVRRVILTANGKLKRLRRPLVKQPNFGAHRNSYKDTLS